MILKKRNKVTMAVDPEGKKILKKLAIELDSTVINLTKDLAEYEKELLEMMKRKKR